MAFSMLIGLPLWGRVLDRIGAGKVLVFSSAATIVTHLPMLILQTPFQLVLTRIAFGLTFLWAFFDKTFALGFHTGYDQAGNLDRFGDAAWINGGSPTEGFLAFGADGPFKEFYNSIAGAAWADWLFMLGLLGIGLALTLGIGMRVAAATGALLYVLMWTVVLPPENNPVLDDLVPERREADPVREYWLGRPELTAVELLTATAAAAILAVRR